MFKIENEESYPWVKFTQREAVIYLPLSRINHIYKSETDSYGKPTDFGKLRYSKDDGTIAECDVLMVPEAVEYYRNFNEIFEKGSVGNEKNSA